MASLSDDRPTTLPAGWGCPLQEAIAGVLGTHVDVVAAKGLISREEHIKREATPI
jgi:hypothetical protein